MSLFWIFFVAAFVAAVALSLLRRGRGSSRLLEKPARSPAQRAVYGAVLGIFAATPMVAFWVAPAIAPNRPFSVGSLLIAGTWLFFGLAPMLIAAGRGEFEAFRSSVVRHTSRPFGYLVVLWALAICIALVGSLADLS